MSKNINKVMVYYEDKKVRKYKNQFSRPKVYKKR